MKINEKIDKYLNEKKNTNRIIKDVSVQLNYNLKSLMEDMFYKGFLMVYQIKKSKIY